MRGREKSQQHKAGLSVRPSGHAPVTEVGATWLCLVRPTVHHQEHGFFYSCGRPVTSLVPIMYGFSGGKVTFWFLIFFFPFHLRILVLFTDSVVKWLCLCIHICVSVAGRTNEQKLRDINNPSQGLFTVQSQVSAAVWLLMEWAWFSQLLAGFSSFL